MARPPQRYFRVFRRGVLAFSLILFCDFANLADLRATCAVVHSEGEAFQNGTALRLPSPTAAAHRTRKVVARYTEEGIALFDQDSPSTHDDSPDFRELPAACSPRNASPCRCLPFTSSLFLRLHTFLL